MRTDGQTDMKTQFCEGAGKRQISKKYYLLGCEAVYYGRAYPLFYPIGWVGTLLPNVYKFVRPQPWRRQFVSSPPWENHIELQLEFIYRIQRRYTITLYPELNTICYLLALLGAHHFLHVSRIRVKLLTFRLLMSYIYIWSTYSWCF